MLLVILFLISSCNSNNYDTVIKADKMKYQNYDILSFKDYNHFDSIYDKNPLDSTSGFYLNNKIYLSEFNLGLKIWRNLNDNERHKNSFIIVDTFQKAINFWDVPMVSFNKALSYTKNFYFFQVRYEGDYLIYHNPDEKWINGFFLFHKNNLDKYKVLKFVNKYPELIEEKNERIRIILSRVERKINLICYVLSFVISRSHKWEYVRTGEYEELLIDSTLQIVSQKKISKEEIFK